MKTNGIRAWWLASRPKTLTGAIAPVLVGGAMALLATSSRHITKNIDMYGQLTLSDTYLQGRLAAVLIPFALCLLFAVLMQICANFINDYFDFRKGTDRADRLGPPRACAQGWVTPRAMLVAIALTTLLSCAVGLLIMAWHIQTELLVVGLLCVVFSFLYTTCLSYLGWGDLLVVLFFGLVPVFFTYYVMCSGEWCAAVILAGLAMGLATDNLLLVNNYRDRNQDVVSGKRTIVVRIISHCVGKYGEREGRRRGESICRSIYLWLGILATILALLALGLFPYTSTTWYCHAAILTLYLVFHVHAYRQLSTLDGKALNQVLGKTARNIFLFGLLVAAAFGC